MTIIIYFSSRDRGRGCLGEEEEVLYEEESKHQENLHRQSSRREGHKRAQGERTLKRMDVY